MFEKIIINDWTKPMTREFFFFEKDSLYIKKNATKAIEEILKAVYALEGNVILFFLEQWRLSQENDLQIVGVLGENVFTSYNFTTHCQS